MAPTREEIAEARREAGLTQAEAAAMIGRKRLTWHRWEKGDPVDIVRWEQFVLKTAKLRKKK